MELSFSIITQAIIDNAGTLNYTYKKGNPELIMRSVNGIAPIASSVSLDLRSLDHLTRRQKVLYTVISWFC